MAAFDEYGDSYGEVVQRSIAFSGLKHDLFMQAKARILAEVLAAQFGAGRASLLDVGCGVGSLHDHLKPLVRGLAGCDPSGTSLAQARLRRESVDYRQQVVGSPLPWPDAAFDATLAVCVFHHVTRDERGALLAEMIRVTRRGGLVLMIEHNPWNPLTRLAVARCPFDADAELLDARKGARLLRAAGLGRVAARHFLALPSAGRAAGLIERPLARLPIGAQYLVQGEA